MINNSQVIIFTGCSIRRYWATLVILWAIGLLSLWLFAIYILIITKIPYLGVS